MARKLEISTATLRRWSDEFSEYLSSKADSDQGRSHRRYTDDDFDTFLTVKALMSNGLTYEQARQELTDQFDDPSGPVTRITPDYEMEDATLDESEQALDMADEEETDDDEDEMALVASNGSESPVIAFLTNTLTTLSDTQKSILNSQSANRELIGVLIQDNFNLKEENNRLRERILDVERTLAQTRQEDEWRREALRQEMEAKVASVEQIAQQAITTAQSVEVPEIKTIKNNPGCLGSLLGMSDTQQIVVPRRQSREGRPERRASGPSPAPYQQPYASPRPAQQQPVHPKPTRPPE